MYDDGKDSDITLDLTSNHFDARKALYSRNVQLPCPNAPVLDNLTKFVETEEGVSVKISRPSTSKVRLPIYDYFLIFFVQVKLHFVKGKHCLYLYFSGFNRIPPTLLHRDYIQWWSRELQTFTAKDANSSPHLVSLCRADAKLHPCMHVTFPLFCRRAVRNFVVINTTR